MMPKRDAGNQIEFINLTRKFLPTIAARELLKFLLLPFTRPTFSVLSSKKHSLVCQLTKREALDN